MSESVGPTRILLADDDDEMRRMLASALRREGYVVVEARNGTDLLNRVCLWLYRTSEGPGFDLLVADIRMPGCSGLDVLSVVRGVDGATPVMMITAFGDEETHSRVRSMGADAILDKPFDLADFRSAVASLAPPQ